MAAEEQSIQNVIDAAIVPVDARKFRQVLGAAEYVAAEVLVSYLARYVFKMEKRSVMELTAIHAVSLPFIGGLSAPVDEPSVLGYEAPVSDQFYDGAKGVPAVFLAQYTVNTALGGLHAPKINAKDIMITAAAKLVTRPILSFLYPMLGDAFRTNLDVLDGLFSKQRAKSNFKSEDAGAASV